ncbi:MAG: methyl-accepting chemotaxis protein, partial [Verrucomicrobia bacterium]|nr:methyl-accepting chemotaxis protein [Verrucomicrobiota bacterium]
MVSCLLLGILPLALAGFLAVRKSFNATERAEGQVLQGNAEQVIDKVDRMLFERYGDVQAFAFHPAAQGTPAEFTSAANFYMGAYGTYDLMILADAEGKIIAANTANPEGKPVDTSALIGLSVKGESWFEECISGKIQSGESFVSDLIADPLTAAVLKTTGLTLNFSAPVFGPDGKPVRVWSNRASWERTVREILGGLDQAMRNRGAKGFELLLISRDRRVLEQYPVSKVGTAAGAPVVQLPALEKDAGYFNARRPNQGGEEIVAYAKSQGIQVYKGHGWNLLIREPSSDAMADPRALQKFFLTLGAVAVVAVWIVAKWLSRGISAPLEAAVQVLEQVAEGNLTRRLENSGSDETARMGRSLNTALDSVCATLKHVDDAAHTLAGASSELSAVSMQIRDSS